jgi:hypothetical protein
MNEANDHPRKDMLIKSGSIKKNRNASTSGKKDSGARLA